MIVLQSLARASVESEVGVQASACDAGPVRITAQVRLVAPKLCEGGYPSPPSYPVPCFSSASIVYRKSIPSEPMNTYLRLFQPIQGIKKIAVFPPASKAGQGYPNLSKVIPSYPSIQFFPLPRRPGAPKSDEGGSLREGGSHPVSPSVGECRLVSPPPPRGYFFRRSFATHKSLPIVL
jgi:hypothetical protein